jgi:CheY-like chemotaxis protein
MVTDGLFDVCILDLNLPDISGYDLLQQLLALHSEQRPVTIALTGFGRPEDVGRLKAAGFGLMLPSLPTSLLFGR